MTISNLLHWLEEIRKVQDDKFPEIKKKVLEEVEKTANLVEIMNFIGSLGETYTKKMYTTYREDEVWIVNATLEKLERLVTYLALNNSEVNETNHIYKEDPDLLFRFKNDEDHKSSILNMIIDGARLLLEEGFDNIPDQCKDKTEWMKLERAEDQDPLTLFLNEEFVVKDDSKKIERSNFNQCVIKYSKIKFNKSFRTGKINESMRQKGYSEKKIKGIFHFDKIDINKSIFDKWLEDNINTL